tara:strand:- start:1860 stop:2090 length:231 start_codon:yes stop_codon:yes gene_type:complete
MNRALLNPVHSGATIVALQLKGNTGIYEVLEELDLLLPGHIALLILDNIINIHFNSLYPNRKDGPDGLEIFLRNFL